VRQTVLVDVFAHELAVLGVADRAIAVDVAGLEQLEVGQLLGVADLVLLDVVQPLGQDVLVGVDVGPLEPGPGRLHLGVVHGYVLPVLQDDLVLLGLRVTDGHEGGVGVGGGQ